MSPPARRTLKEKFRWAHQHWVSRSLMVGAAATALDILILLVCVKGFGAPNPVGAMVGVLFGSTFTFFANRHFAFRDHKPNLAPQAVKFVSVTAVSMLIHAYLVHLLADNWGVPVVLAKMAADILVFSVGQLLMLRYIVFPKWKPKDVPASEPVRQIVDEAVEEAEHHQPVSVPEEAARRSA